MEAKDRKRGLNPAGAPRGFLREDGQSTPPAGGAKAGAGSGETVVGRGRAEGGRTAPAVLPRRGDAFFFAGGPVIQNHRPAQTTQALRLPSRFQATAAAGAAFPVLDAGSVASRFWTHARHMLPTPDSRDRVLEKICKSPEDGKDPGGNIAEVLR